MFKGVKSTNNEGRQLEKYRIHKTLAICSGVGGSYGLLVVVLFFAMNGEGFTETTWPIIIGIPVFCAVTSGLAGLGGVYINYFLIKIGITNIVKRQVIEFIASVFMAIIVGMGIAAALGLINLENQLPLIIIMCALGCTIGAVFTVVNYRFLKIRQKVSALEIENKYLAELAEKDRQLKETTKNLVIAEERNRLARELHDSISQGIHGIIFSVHSLRQQLGAQDKRAAEILNHLQKTADATLDELRAMILELKPSLLEERGLAEALKLHCELVARRLQIGLNLQIDRIIGLTPEQEMAIYRIVQEALANIQQHAEATQVNISLVKEEEQVKLTIHDTGKGFSSERIKRGNGLNNMEARCRENAGTLNILTKPGTGTTIKAEFAINN